jgi:glycogen phosphorylase
MTFAQETDCRFGEGITRELLRHQATVLASNFYQGPSSRRIKEILGNLTEDPDNPWLALNNMTDEKFSSIVSSNGLSKSIQAFYKEFTKYMSEKENTWFMKTASLSPREKEYLKKHPIASFSLEIAINKIPQIYSGGLGMLNGDKARQESDMNLPVDNISFLYRGGYFIQKIEDGCQVEVYHDQNGNDFPMFEAKDVNGDKIGLLTVPMGKDHNVFAKTWEVGVGRNKLYLLDTNIPENKNEADRWITGHLYSEVNNDTRIRQEVLLGIGGVRLLKALGKEPSIYHLQEGHAAFATLEIAANLVESGVPLIRALWEAADKTALTNHTIVIDDFFMRELIAYYFDPIAQRMSTPKCPVKVEDLYDLGKDKQGRFSMTLLGMRESDRKNAVSKIHKQALGEQYPGEKIEAITNGIHIETWLGEPMHDLLSKYLGQIWREDLDSKEIFNEIFNIPEEELWEVHMEQKKRFISYANGKYGCDFSPNILTGCVARRFAGYKRNSLLFYDMDKLSEIVGNNNCPLQIFIGGKAHPYDFRNKEVIKYINEKIKDPRLIKRMIFVPEYDMELAKRLVSGVDLWMNYPRRKHEASGTSGMKAAINGVLQFTEKDGWANEVDWWDKGWTIGRLEDDATKMGDAEMEIVDRRDAEDMYRQFKESIVPAYYSRRNEWVARMKNTMVEVLTNYSTRRMVKEQIEKIYRPMLQKQLAQAV